MLNTILNTAIADFHTAEANVPFTAPDDEMDAAVRKAADALDRVCRIPSVNEGDVDAKLTLAGDLVEWDVPKERLIKKAYEELLTIQANRKARVS